MSAARITPQGPSTAARMYMDLAAGIVGPVTSAGRLSDCVCDTAAPALQGVSDLRACQLTLPAITNVRVSHVPERLGTNNIASGLRDALISAQLAPRNLSQQHSHGLCM
eukprot:GHUV01054520.1.p1 GENE.GHUV01054520.1~~GHUV01054520.1.p1  ORF type:complete len:109 (-),score=17.70 GHUV01054520.1:227-553(-)